MPPFDLILFDCDGVLIDSEKIATQIEAEILTNAGFPISTRDVAERFSGKSWEQILRDVEAESGLTLADRLATVVEDLLDERLPIEIEAIAGVEEMLTGLILPHCICSNTKLSRIEILLDKVGLRHYFAPNIFSAKDLGPGRSKPAPDVYLHGAAVMGADPARCVVVEDSVHGVMAGCAAGMTVIGFTGGGHTFSRHAGNLLAAGAKTTLSDMRELPQVMAQCAIGG